ncbi:uncharacterized protein SCHCODRAFT_02686881 [Schizophyllum commune H4-8]|uniref:uncharacterized protein n=1 Tax=Schizophyllum commune (strain H4-8 / FGSC 9210) TaxID=578458 RepID=UPI00215E8BAF|nr:uncharacterized protein SCHCODRAFT_02686881 [Schizophyllum commune H4-8]KAI5895505.1 hypothetical protein SCHCODRAFT_02686881 [Schizophyllum commune H4-8]
MASLLRLHKPSTFLGLLAITLNAAAVIAAYKVNPVPVTVCGALGILATIAAYIMKRLPAAQNFEPLRRQRRDSFRLESIVTEPFSGESSSVITTEPPTVARSSGNQVGAGEPEVLRERRAPVGDDRAVEDPREHILLSTPYNFVRVHLTAPRIGG